MIVLLLRLTVPMALQMELLLPGVKVALA